MESIVAVVVAASSAAADPRPTQSEDVSQLHDIWRKEVTSEGVKVGEWNQLVWSGLYRWLQAQRRDLLWGMFRKVRSGEGPISAITTTLGETDYPEDLAMFAEEAEEFNELPRKLQSRVEEALRCARGLTFLDTDNGVIFEEELDWLERWRGVVGEGGTDWEGEADRLLLGIE